MAKKRSRSKQRRSGGANANEVEVADVQKNAPQPPPPPSLSAQERDNNNNSNVDVTTTDASSSGQEGSATNTKLEQMWNNTQSSLTTNLVSIISRPEELLTTLLSTDATSDDNGGGSSSSSKQQLLSTCTQLFRYIEHLAHMEVQLKEIQTQRKLNEFNKEDEKMDEGEDDDGNVEDEEGDPCTLSGLPALYTGDEHSSHYLDAETIWGQVDLQNTSLLPLLKKIIKKLGKRCGNEEGKYGEEEMVRILNTHMDSDAEEEGEESDESGEDSEGDGGDDISERSVASDFDPDNQEEEEDGADSDEDMQARRIRIRMERTMANMDEEESHESANEDEDDPFHNKANDSSTDKQARLQELAAKAAVDEGQLEEEAIDPTREDMRDGFFDLHEMEAFADEEEEMLPDDAYGEPEKEVEKKGKKNKGVLPHLRDRMGEDSDDEDENGSDDDDEDGDDALTKRFEPTTVRRKKYRADDEVDALYNMYDNFDNDNDGLNDDSDDDEEGGGNDASNLTAADFFGKPNAKLIKSYKAKHTGKKGEGKADADKKKKAGSKKKGLLDDSDDADSWDEHNFEEDGTDWKKDGKENDEDDGEENDGEEEDQVDEEGEEQEEMNDVIDSSEKLSAHAIHSQKLKEQTLQLEHDLIAEKPWKMMGEAKSTSRPADSLLDSTPEFEVAFKPPPILTAEHTADIETMIKKRVLDEDYDDVVPRELPDIGAHKRGGEAPEVSQEKSKLGLGELYEREYLKKSTGYDRTADEKQTVEDAAKDEMKELFANLCSQLDALSNYHFAPRPVAEEAEITNTGDNRPAIAMEEVLPLHVSNSRGQAPEEIYGKKGQNSRETVLKGESELDQAERKRIRSAKKAARRKSRKQTHADEKLISKLQPGLGLNNPYEKRKLREELQMARASGKFVIAKDDKGLLDEAAVSKEYQTSTKFFAKMQENVDSMIHGDDEDGGSKKRRKQGLEAGKSSSVYRL